MTIIIIIFYQISFLRLHVAAVKKLLCRENEFDEILKFIKTKMRHKLSGCMYIAGVPGTGKTATMYQVTRHLNEARNLPSFKFIELNGLKVSEPKQAYVEILKVSRCHYSNCPYDLRYMVRMLL
jgi:origin recognition complex subunit 1